MKQKLLLLILLSLPLIAGGQSITLVKNTIVLDTTFAREDLERDQLKDLLFDINRQIIDNQESELEKKDTIVSLQATKIQSLYNEKLALSDMVVLGEKNIRKQKRMKVIFQGLFTGAMIIITYIAVK
jgi:hypothetical protein